jgi:hypothetical protein
VFSSLSGAAVEIQCTTNPALINNTTFLGNTQSTQLSSTTTQEGDLALSSTCSGTLAFNTFISNQSNGSALNCSASTPCLLTGSIVESGGGCGSGINTSSYYNLLDNAAYSSCAGNINDIHDLGEQTDIATSLSPANGDAVPSGGIVPTLALLTGAPAIGGVPNGQGSCATSSNPITTDARGYLRPAQSGGNCSIGAYEYGSSAP